LEDAPLLSHLSRSQVLLNQRANFRPRYIQRYYRATSRELRRLEAVSRSPIYGALGDATHGATSIRAYKAQRGFAKARRCALRGWGTRARGRPSQPAPSAASLVKPAEMRHAPASLDPPPFLEPLPRSLWPWSAPTSAPLSPLRPRRAGSRSACSCSPPPSSRPSRCSPPPPRRASPPPLARPRLRGPAAALTSRRAWWGWHWRTACRSSACSTTCSAAWPRQSRRWCRLSGCSST
jgi:hypothetical protein